MRSSSGGKRGDEGIADRQPDRRVIGHGTRQAEHEQHRRDGREQGREREPVGQQAAGRATVGVQHRPDPGDPGLVEDPRQDRG